jgi:hypothetical protein
MPVERCSNWLSAVSRIRNNPQTYPQSRWIQQDILGLISSPKRKCSRDGWLFLRHTPACLAHLFCAQFRSIGRAVIADQVARHKSFREAAHRRRLPLPLGLFEKGPCWHIAMELDRSDSPQAHCHRCNVTAARALPRSPIVAPACDVNSCVVHGPRRVYRTYLSGMYGTFI